VYVAIDEIWQYWQLSGDWNYQLKATTAISSRSASADIGTSFSWYQV